VFFFFFKKKKKILNPNPLAIGAQHDDTFPHEGGKSEVFLYFYFVG
jgi:hypothetical protein